MQIHIIDGPPSLWATDLVRNIESRSSKGTTLYIPRFAKKLDQSKISSDSVAQVVQGSIRDLIDRIEIAEQSKYTKIVLDGSPITYLAHARVLGVEISPSTSSQIDLLCTLVRWSTKVSLRVPNTWLIFRNNIHVMTPSDIRRFGTYLEEEYKNRLKTNIKRIGSN